MKKLAITDWRLAIDEGRRRRYSCVLLMLVCIIPLSVRAADPRGALELGEQAYRAKQYEPARQAFAAAATNAATRNLDPAVARYNEAAANYRLGHMEAAAERLAETLRTDDLALQQKAWYNRGTALLGQMAAQRQQGKLDDAQKVTAEAATHFEQAIMLDPNDADAKVNYELALRLQAELEKQKQQQQKDDPKQDQKKQQDQQKQDQQEQKQAEQKKQDEQQQQPEQKQAEQSSAPKPEQQQEKSAAQGEKKTEMTPEEAAMLLNAMRQEEQSHRDKMRLNIGQPEPVEKDW
jgi:Ca-activated chloride channel family protein